MLRFVRAAALVSTADWKDTCEAVYPSLFYLRKEGILVSGFFVSAGGVGLTVNHFWEQVKGEMEGATLHHNGQVYEFKVLARSSQKDVMVVQPRSTHSFPYLRLQSASSLLQGDQVCVFGTNQRLIHCFVPGFVLDPAYSLMKSVIFPCIRSSCRAEAGYSGGPLTLPSGEVVGIHKAETQLFEKISDSAAIPIKEAIEVLRTVARETETGWERR
jgi:S1-C subfamily serine protease